MHCSWKNLGKTRRIFLLIDLTQAPLRGSYSLRFFIPGEDTQESFCKLPWSRIHLINVVLIYGKNSHLWWMFCFFKYQKSSLNGKLTLCCFPQNLNNHRTLGFELFWIPRVLNSGLWWWWDGQQVFIEYLQWYKLYAKRFTYNFTFILSLVKTLFSF